MAHKQRRARDSARATAHDDDDGAAGSVLERRNYLRLAAAAVTTVAAGGSAAAAEPDADEAGRWLSIRGGDDPARYELTVGGALVAGDGGDDARISGSSAEGVVGEEARRYRFDGGIRDLTVDGDAEVRVGTVR